VNKYVINAFILIFWLAISVSDAWGTFRERFYEEDASTEEQTLKVKNKILECSNILNNIQIEEAENEGIRFPGAFYLKEGDKF